jgi:hypothetical protein
MGGSILPLHQYALIPWCLVKKPEWKRSLEDLGIEGKMEIQYYNDLSKLGRKLLTGCIWLRIGTSGGLL